MPPCLSEKVSVEPRPERRTAADFLALCSWHITCASTCGSVSEVEDRALDLTCSTCRGRPLSCWAEAGRSITSKATVDVSMPRNLKGLRIDPVGQTARFSVNGELEFEADTGEKLDSLVRAQRSTALGLACCFFKLLDVKDCGGII